MNDKMNGITFVDCALECPICKNQSRFLIWTNDTLKSCWICYLKEFKDNVEAKAKADVQVKLVFLMSKYFQSTGEKSFIPIGHKNDFCVEMYDYIKSLASKSPQQEGKQ